MKTRGMFLLLSCLFLAVPGLAAPWGLMYDYVDEAQPENTGNKYLMRTILDGQPIIIELDRSDYTAKHYRQLYEMIAESYQEWFNNALHYIQKEQRTDEFADILPLLQRRIEVRLDGSQRPDILFAFVSLGQIRDICGGKADGCYIGGDDEMPRVFLPANDGLIKVLTQGKQSKHKIGVHEIGHSLGISDQYKQARSENSDPVYSSVQTDASIMNRAGGLKCDDADGLINLIDITRGTRRGGKQGWKSLCKKSKEYYINGIPASKYMPYRVELSKGLNSAQLVVYQNGQKTDVQTYSFDTSRVAVPWQETPVQQIQEKDRFGRTLKATGPNEETIYFTYWYDRTDRMAVKNGAVVDFSRKIHYKEKGKESRFKEIFFGQYATVCAVRFSSAGKGYTAEYAEGVEKQRNTVYVKRGYTKKGQLVQDIYRDENDGSPRAKPAVAPRQAESFSARLTARVKVQSAPERNSRLISHLDQWGWQTMQEFEKNPPKK